jgi:acid stress chaperone HdeB
MKRKIPVVTMLVFILTAMFSVHAATIDMSAATCADLLKIENEEESAWLIVWLDGYLSGMTGDTVINSDQLKQFVKKLKDFAENHPDTQLIQAAETIGIGKK